MRSRDRNETEFRLPLFFFRHLDAAVCECVFTLNAILRCEGVGDRRAIAYPGVPRVKNSSRVEWRSTRLVRENTSGQASRTETQSCTSLPRNSYREYLSCGKRENAPRGARQRQEKMMHVPSSVVVLPIGRTRGQTPLPLAIVLHVLSRRATPSVFIARHTIVSSHNARDNNHPGDIGGEYLRRRPRFYVDELNDSLRRQHRVNEEKEGGFGKLAVQF